LIQLGTPPSRASSASASAADGTSSGTINRFPAEKLTPAW